MAVDRVEVDYAIEGNAGALLDSQRVIGWLQLDNRPLAAISWMNAAFQIQGIRVALHMIGKPPEPRAERSLIPVVERRAVEIEVRLRQRGPDIKPKCFARPPNQGQLEDTAHEMVFAADDAKILGEDVLRTL